MFATIEDHTLIKDIQKEILAHRLERTASPVTDDYPSKAKLEAVNLNGICTMSLVYIKLHIIY
jgi:hypothetical protein